jgi:hypothetical protein
MKRFYPDVEQLVKNKAHDLYRDCCVEIIEQNGLKNKAIDCAIRICYKHIDDDKKSDRDNLTTLIPTLKNIIGRLKILKKESTYE